MYEYVLPPLPGRYVLHCIMHGMAWRGVARSECMARVLVLGHIMVIVKVLFLWDRIDGILNHRT